MSLRHQQLRDTYFKQLNALILDACITWQKSDGKYDPKKLPRTDYFLENVLKTSARPFWRRARAGVDDLEKQAIIDRDDYERFLDRIKPYASEHKLQEFVSFIDNTFLAAELNWNAERSTLRSLNQTFETLGLPRTRRWRVLADPDHAAAIAQHVEHLAFENKVKQAIAVGKPYLDALNILHAREPKSTTACEAFYLHALPVATTLCSYGVDIELPRHGSPWVFCSRALLLLNTQMSQNAITIHNLQDTIDIINHVEPFFGVHALAGRAEDPNVRMVLAFMGPTFRKTYGYDDDAPLGHGKAIPKPHPLLAPLIVDTRLILRDYFLAMNSCLDTSPFDPADTFREMLNLNSSTLKELNGHPHYNPIRAHFYLGQALIEMNAKRSLARIETAMIQAHAALSAQKSAAYATEFYLMAARYMSMCGNAYFEACAWQKVAKLQKLLGAEDGVAEANKANEYRQFNPLPPNIPKERAFYDDLGAFLKSEDLFWTLPTNPSSR